MTTSNTRELTVPIYPNFDQNSELSQRMIEAKRVNDKSFWPTMMEVIDSDYNTLPLEFFKVWASFMIVPMMSMSKHMEYIQCTTEMVRKDVSYFRALKEPMVGINQELFSKMYSVFDNYPTSMNRIHHMSHLIMCGFTKEKISKMNSILEIGAGSGDMADIVHKLGFRGKYYVYDFPQLMKVQQWYHRQLGINATYIDDPNDLQNVDMCIATWSLTEMPIELRDSIVNKINETKNYLICYSNRIFDYDNDDYIKNNFLEKIGRHAQFIDVPWMPWDGGTKYLVIKNG